MQHASSRDFDTDLRDARYFVAMAIIEVKKASAK